MLKFKEYFLQETRKVSSYSYGPEKDGEEYYRVYDDHVWIKMSPENFLTLAYPMKDYSEYDKESFHYNRKKILSGDNSGIIYLDIDKNLGVRGHEGRHRSIVLKNLGIKQIPVLITWSLQDKLYISKRMKDVFSGNFIPEKRNEQYLTYVRTKNKKNEERNKELLFDEIYEFVKNYSWLEYQPIKNIGYQLFPSKDTTYDDYLIYVGVIRDKFFISYDDNKVIYVKSLNELMDKLKQWEKLPQNQKFK